MSPIDEVAAGLQGLRAPGVDRRRSPRHSTPICQGRSSPFMRGVKLWMAITAGTTPAAAERGDAAGDRAVVGQEVAEHAVDLAAGVEALVARDDAAVADLGDRGRRARAPVGVDHQPRHVVQDRRRVQQPGELAGDFGGADVPADMLRQGLVAQAELLEFGGTWRPAWSHRRRTGAPPRRVEQLEMAGLGDRSSAAWAGIRHGRRA